MERVRLPELETLTVDTLAEVTIFASPFEAKEAIDILMHISDGMASVSRTGRKSEAGAPADTEFTRVSWAGPNFFVSWASDRAERIRVESSFQRGMKFLDLREFGAVDGSYCSRVDYCYDIGENLNVFRRMYSGPSRWEKVDFRGGSIWRAEGKRLRIYDKAREARLKRGVTRWRIEVSYQSKRAVEYHTCLGGDDISGRHEGFPRRAILKKAIGSWEDFKGSFGKAVDYQPNNEDFKKFVRLMAPNVVEEFFRITDGKKNARRFQHGFI